MISVLNCLKIGTTTKRSLETSRLGRIGAGCSRWVALAVALLCGLWIQTSDPAVAAPAPVADWDTFSDTWVATDALGRSLPSAAETGAPRTGKTVGIFYFLWLEGNGPVYDNSKLLAVNPTDPAYGPKGAFHFWGEPLFGYYRADDEAVIRKHAQMLSDAGVDVIFFDVTNGLIYEQNYLAVCRVFSQMRGLGQRTPQIAFLANSRHEQVVTELSKKFYSEKLYSDLWFNWKGKPLLLSPPDGLSPAIAQFFTLRQAWAWTSPKGWFGDGHDKWPWIDHTPQGFGWHESPKRAEQISVATAEHPVANIGRSFFNGHQPPPGQTATEVGRYFGEQWQRALQVNPEFVFVTGWNEWVAQRFINQGEKISMLGRKLKPDETYFVDQYNQEFSRDIEPMKGGHGDNYYYQLVNYVRRYKGARPVPEVSTRPIEIDGSFDDWQNVGPEFRDSIGDPVHRDHPGWQGEKRFLNQTGRNDIMAAKVSRDASQLYFYVRTVAPLTASSDPYWMQLFIDADNNPKTGWLGYDYVLNRSNVRTNVTTLERNVDGKYEWGSPVDVPFRCVGNEMEVALPRSAVGMLNATAVMDFKWTDNIQQTGEASDFTLNGDAAPNDRFNFRAVFGHPERERLAQRRVDE